MDFEAEKKEMAETQLHFIKYASEEIIEYIQMGGTVEEWYQNKLSKVHSDMEGLHSWIEGEKRRTGMVEETELEEASLRKRIAQRGRIETKLLAMKDDDAKMAAFLINQDDQKELAKFLKSLDPKSRKAIEAVMNEGYVSHAQRKAVWASRNDEKEKKKMKKEGTDFAAHRAAQSTAPTQADREKMRKVAQLLAKERKMKKEELEAVEEAKYYDSGWRKVSGPRKDKYGNIVKNAAKHLAKKGMAAAQSDKMNKEEVEQIDEAKTSIRVDIPYYDDEPARAKKVASKHRVKVVDKGRDYQITGDKKNIVKFLMDKDTLEWDKYDIEWNFPELFESVQIDELSNDTLRSYNAKAGKEAGELRRSTNRSPEDDKKWKNRIKGQQRAVNTMVQRRKDATFGTKKEEVEQTDEARSYKVPSNYAAMMMKKRKKAGTSEFGRHPDKKLSPAQDNYLDVHDDDKIDAKDFKKLRDMKKDK